MVIYMSGSTPYNDVEVMCSEQSAGSICMEGAVRTEAPEPCDEKSTIADKLTPKWHCARICKNGLRAPRPAADRKRIWCQNGIPDSNNQMVSIAMLHWHFL